MFEYKGYKFEVKETRGFSLWNPDPMTGGVNGDFRVTNDGASLYFGLSELGLTFSIDPEDAAHMQRALIERALMAAELPMVSRDDFN